MTTIQTWEPSQETQSSQYIIAGTVSCENYESTTSGDDTEPFVDSLIDFLKDHYHDCQVFASCNRGKVTVGYYEGDRCVRFSGVFPDDTFRRLTGMLREKKGIGYKLILEGEE